MSKNSLHHGANYFATGYPNGKLIWCKWKIYRLKKTNLSPCRGWLIKRVLDEKKLDWQVSCIGFLIAGIYFV